MPNPWQTIDSVSTDEGLLELRRRGDKDYLITVGGRVLMNSHAHRTETALGRLACGHIRGRQRARVLVGGLGMGYTLRAVLDDLARAATVVVAELNPVVLAWCRGPLSALTAGAVADPRVLVEIDDVAHLIYRCAKAGGELEKFDAIVLDLYTGPYARTHKRDDPLWGTAAMNRTRTALKPGGVFAVWGEDHDAGFEKRLRSCGFSVATERLGRGGPRHVVYLCKDHGTQKHKGWGG